MGVPVCIEVKELGSVDGTVIAEVDAGIGYVRMRVDTSGDQAIMLLRCKDSDQYVFMLYDASRFDSKAYQWSGWEVVCSSLGNC